MSDIAIRVEHLGKAYRISHEQTRRYRTVQEEIVGLVKRPFSRHEGKHETFWALNDVSFEVKTGEALGIIGRNGAGKSTLLKILSRITHPTTGYVDVYGRVGSLLEVGTGFHPELTGRENIYLNGAILGMTRRDISRRFDEIVAFADVDKFLDTPAKRYSSGMYMRLAFSVAAHLEPEILVVDEVLAVGDIAFQKKCLGKMNDVAKEGRTVLFVSHNMAALRNLCTTGLQLERGCIETSGPTEQVISHYLSKSSSELSAAVTLPTGAADAPGFGTCLYFSTDNGAPQAQFRLGERWRINLEFTLTDSVQHVIAAVGLLNVESLPIITYWSEPKDLTAGRYHIEFVCDLPLAAGDLEFVIGLSSYERTFYYVSSVGNVSISHLAVGEQPVRASGAGLLVSAQHYTIERVGE